MKFSVHAIILPFVTFIVGYTGGFVPAHWPHHQPDHLRLFDTPIKQQKQANVEQVDRRTVARRLASLAFAASAMFGTTTTAPQVAAHAKCTDIESCREIGERKVEQDMQANPTTRLESGVRYKILKPSLDRSGTTQAVHDGSKVDMIYSISAGSGQYMYSQGFGFEKAIIDGGSRSVSDLGIDSLRIQMGRHEVPVGIEAALIGMRRGERRRVELPPNVGFATSNWQPAPVTRRGKTQIADYQRKLQGFGSQPPFPAVTIWDIEVLNVR